MKKVNSALAAFAILSLVFLVLAIALFVGRAYRHCIGALILFLFCAALTAEERRESRQSERMTREPFTTDRASGHLSKRKQQIH